MVAFWGERYGDYLADLLLPSLLAPNNLPLLDAADGHRFFIASPRAEWETIERLPIMDRLRRHAQPQWVEVQSAPDTSHIRDAQERYVAVLAHMKATRARMPGRGSCRLLKRRARSLWALAPQPTSRSVICIPKWKCLKRER
jgi:hypothetical protein